MSRKKSKKRNRSSVRGTYSGTKTTTGSNIFFLMDNAHREIADEIASAKRLEDPNIIYPSNLGLLNDVDDYTMVSTACNAYSPNTVLVVVTKDRGKGDGIMPKVITDLRLKGFNVKVATYSPTLTKGVATSMFHRVLETRSSYFSRSDAVSIHMSPNEGSYLVTLELQKGRKKTSRIKKTRN